MLQAGYIAETLTLAALQGGKNVLQDGSLRDHEWYEIFFHRLRREFPQVRQAIIHVTAPRETVLERAAQRALVTGRIVPNKILEETLRQVPRSMKILSKLVDYYAEVNNPKDKDIELIEPKDGTWASFRKNWTQTVAFVGDKDKVFKKVEEAKRTIRLREF